MQSSKLLLLLVALLVVVLGGAWWLLDDSSGSATDGVTLAAGSKAADGVARPAAELAAPSAAAAGIDAAGPDEASPPAGQRTDAVLASSRELNVRISLPLAAPADPELAVIAVSAALLDTVQAEGVRTALRAGELAATQYARATFRGNAATLRLPEGMQAPRLILDGRFLYLEPAAIVGDADTSLLEPELGACLVVRVEAPREIEFSGVVSLMGSNPKSGWRDPEILARPISAPGEVEFGALNPDFQWIVSPDVEGLWGPMDFVPALEPGQVTTRDLRLTRGAAVAGVVVDEAGVPVPAASVDPGQQYMSGTLANLEPFETLADGRFEFTGLEPGERTVHAEAPGYVDASSEQLELVEGERRDELRLVLRTGLAIAGRVVLPDGFPAADADVKLEQAIARGGFRSWARSRRNTAGEDNSDAQGRFRISGLEAGKFSVSATLEIGDDPATTTWRASASDVAAGRTDVLLELAGPIPFAGRVLDDRGEPVADFKLRAQAVGNEGLQVERAFEDTDGSFVFDRVGPGEWELVAEAQDHTDSEAELVTLPGQAESLELRVARRASIAGRVVDSLGNAIAGAEITAHEADGERPRWLGRQGPATKADADGHFQVLQLAAGTPELTANAEGWAKSVATPVELAPGEQRTGVDLVLRVGGRIEGVVFDPDGEPWPGRRISFGAGMTMGFGGEDEATSDGAGRFVFEHVTPGEWAVSAVPDLSEITSMARGGRGDQAAVMDLMSQILTETVNVADGQTSEVFLGGDPKQPVRVFGNLSRAEEPVAGAQVVAVSEGSAVFQGMKSATTEADGSYELVVDRPGAYALTARSGARSVIEEIDVPAQDQFRVDLVIPLGRIEGRVRQPDGEPAAGVRLSLRREGSGALGGMAFLGGQEATEEDGRYAFEDLAAGRYTVRVNVSTWPGSQATEWGGAVRDGIVVEADQPTTGVDFRLEAAGTVRGVVRGPDGTPASDVTLFLRDASGRLLSPISGTATDAAGRFEQVGVSPGSYTISARGKTLAASDGSSVAVHAGEVAEVELEVELGVTVVVTLEEPDGTASRARVEVLDDAGRDLAAPLTADALQTAFTRGISSRESRVGPLPPGRYTVRATAPDGRSDSRKVTLRSRDAERSVRLKLEAESGDE